LSTAHPCKFEEALRETGLGADFWQGSSGLAGTPHMPASAQALQTMDEIFQEDFLAVPGVEPCSYFVAIDYDRGYELKLDVFEILMGHTEYFWQNDANVLLRSWHSYFLASLVDEKLCRCTP
jgi:hypothetical protein